MEYHLEELFMKTTKRGIFEGYDEGDLDLLILMWLANKEKEYPNADKCYYKPAEQISVWNGVLPKVENV